MKSIQVLVFAPLAWAAAVPAGHAYKAPGAGDGIFNILGERLDRQLILNSPLAMPWSELPRKSWIYPS